MRIKNGEEDLLGTLPTSASATTNGKFWVKVKMYSETLQEWLDITVQDEKMVTQLNMMRKREENIPKFARAFREMGLKENKD